MWKGVCDWGCWIEPENKGKKKKIWLNRSIKINVIVANEFVIVLIATTTIVPQMWITITIVVALAPAPLVRQRIEAHLCQRTMTMKRRWLLPVTMMPMNPSSMTIIAIICEMPSNGAVIAGKSSLLIILMWFRCDFISVLVPFSIDNSNDCIENPIYTKARNRYECRCRHKINQVNLNRTNGSRPTAANIDYDSSYCETNPFSIDSMNYLFSAAATPSEWNWKRMNAYDVVRWHNINQSKQQQQRRQLLRTNNDLYKNTLKSIDFNEISEFRKRYASECISPLNQSIPFGIEAADLTRDLLRTAASMALLRCDDDNDDRSIDWSELNRMCGLRRRHEHLTRERKQAPNQVAVNERLLLLPSQAGELFDQFNHNFALRHQSITTKEWRIKGKLNGETQNTKFRFSHFILLSFAFAVSRGFRDPETVPLCGCHSPQKIILFFSRKM